MNDPPHAAVICAPAHLHIPLATQLAEAGVHLLIEKPLSTGFEGIDRLCSLVREKNLTVSVAYVSRMNPSLAAMRDAIHSGRFGDPVQIIGLSGQNFP
ncbi:MAG: Gfo/Idh/MocA family oxidoreductase, partial [Proteobacteria bacterium]|nr:Gfo/Idh/MocA family oxidoreductase [Pseudomonadota bacterium]